jgi:DNA-directed RNA polymerase subunit RPC12/RpoP
MRHQTVESPSSLPSLMMPCPICAGRMAFHARHPVSAEVEDTVYACRNCGAELIRTSVRQGAYATPPSSPHPVKDAEAA